METLHVAAVSSKAEDCIGPALGYGATGLGRLQAGLRDGGDPTSWSAIKRCRGVYHPRLQDATGKFA